jgi:ferredoxin
MGESRVKLSLDRSACVGHAQCSAICPAMFSSDDLGYAVLLAGGAVPAEVEDDAQLAVDSCPEQAIRVSEP